MSGRSIRVEMKNTVSSVTEGETELAFENINLDKSGKYENNKSDSEEKSGKLNNKPEGDVSTTSVNLETVNFKSETSSEYGSIKFDQEATNLLKSMIGLSTSDDMGTTNKNNNSATNKDVAR